MSRAVTLLATSGALMLALEAPVHAYLDPGSGSMLLQLVLGGGAALAVGLKLLWQRLSSRLPGRHTQEPR